MSIKTIESMAKWKVLKAALKDKGYSLYQFQFRWDHPEGFHAWFMIGDKRVEVVTHAQAVEREIVAYNG